MEDTKNTPRIDKLVRLPDILSALQISRSTWRRGIIAGKFPEGIVLSERVVAWRASDINNLINGATQPQVTQQQ